MRILNVSTQHLISLGLRGRLANHLHLFDELRILPLKCREGNLLVRKGFPALENSVKVDFFVRAIQLVEFGPGIPKIIFYFDPIKMGRYEVRLDGVSYPLLS